jgi:hypothetical protein
MEAGFCSQAKALSRNEQFLFLFGHRATAPSKDNMV